MDKEKITNEFLQHLLDILKQRKYSVKAVLCA